MKRRQGSVLARKYIAKRYEIGNKARRTDGNNTKENRTRLHQKLDDILMYAGQYYIQNGYTTLFN